MIDHITVRVTDYSKSKAFYENALRSIEYTLIAEYHPHETVHIAGFGTGGRAYFWITTDQPHTSFVHVAFCAEDRRAVDAFFSAALSAGGKDNGKPGLRPLYHPDYYGAFVLDFDGNNIEVVCRKKM